MAVDSIRPVDLSEGRADLAATLRTLLKALVKQWPLIAACTILTTGASLVYSKTTPRIYQASSLLEINPHASQPLGEKTDDLFNLGAGLFMDPREYYETQYKILVSNRVLGSVERDLSLAHDADFMRDASTSGSPTPEDAVVLLRRHLTVEPVKASRLVTIRVDDRDPKRARRLCDAIANSYVDQNLQTAITATSDAATWLNGQVDHVKHDLEGDEDALHDFKQRNDLPSTSINEASNMLRVEMQELDLALTHTKTKREEVAARQAELARVPSDNPDQLPASELLASPFLQSLRAQYQQALKEHSAMMAEGKGENHPLVKSETERVTETKRGLLAEVKNIQGAVERDLAALNREEAGENDLFELTRRRAVELNMKEIEYHRLDRTRDQDEKLYSLLLERMKEADLGRMMRANNLRVVDVAIEPQKPVRPRVALNTALGLLIGFLFGIGIALGREQLDSSIKTPDDVETKLGMTFLGLLPEIDESQDTKHTRKSNSRRTKRLLSLDGLPLELIVHARPLSGIAEAARSIRTNLMFMNPDRPYKRLLVSSAAPAEGKTTVACSIAIAFAHGGQRVCIIDCDLRRPRLHRVFGRAGEAGVTNVLVGDATIDEVAKPTAVENLWCIPAGPLPPNPADILHSERFRRFLADLSERFDRIVIDSPPIAAVTDSAIISTLVDGTVFVVRAFKTSKNLSNQGLRALRDVAAPIVGVVLNAVNLDKHEYNYYYHYYYYKRQGYRETPIGPGTPPPESASPPN